MKPCLRVAIPAALQRFATSFGYVAFSSMINTLGATSTAAHTIANTAESAFYIPGYGMQAVASTLIGTSYGENDRHKMRCFRAAADHRIHRDDAERRGAVLWRGGRNEPVHAG